MKGGSWCYKWYIKALFHARVRKKQGTCLQQSSIRKGAVTQTSPLASPPPYIRTWVDRDDTWTTMEVLYDEKGMLVPEGIIVQIMSRAVDIKEHRRAISQAGSIISICQENAEPTDEGNWSALEHRTLLGAIRPWGPFRQPGVYANMRSDCRK